MEMSRMMTAVVSGVLCLSLLAFGGCGMQAPPPRIPASDSPAEAAKALPGQDQTAGDGAEGKLKRQIIYTANLQLAVEEFSGLPERITALVEDHGGFIAHSNLTGRTGAPRGATWKIRIPVIKYGDFLAAAQQLGEVISLTSDSEDVSAEYYDVEARIRNKRTEETRLLKHLEESTGKLDDILAVEREISRVREELERLDGRMRVLKDLTSLTTITLRVDEFKGYFPAQAPTLGVRIGRAFTGSIEALMEVAECSLIAVVAVGPWFLAIGVPFVLLISVIRRRRRLALPKAGT